MPKASPLLVVLSGPSGVGKDSVLAHLKRTGQNYFFVVTATTRPQRPGERDSVDYHFLSQAEFQAMVAEGELLEYAQVYGHWYGVPKKPVRQALEEGKDVIIKADVQGAATIKGVAPQAVAIFLAPPSLEELEQRLRQRHSETPAALALRLKIAQEEMERLPFFDYVVINAQDKTEEAADKIEAIITAEKCRTTPRKVSL